MFTRKATLKRVRKPIAQKYLFADSTSIGLVAQLSNVRVTGNFARFEGSGDSFHP